MSCKKFRSLECAVQRALLFSLIAGTLPCASAFASHTFLCHPSIRSVPSVESGLFCVPVTPKVEDLTLIPTSEDYIIDELCE